MSQMDHFLLNIYILFVLALKIITFWLTYLCERFFLNNFTGIESRLDYFLELGVDTLWVSSIYKSTMEDFGYDVIDFRDIDPVFGTLDDFKDLLSAVHEQGK